MASLIPWRKERDGLKSLGQGFDSSLSQLRNEFETMLDRFFGRWPSFISGEGGTQHFWGLDLDDTGKEIVVRAEAPGFEPGDFDIRITGNTLTIQAERKQESKEGKGETFFSQRRLQKSVTLPAEVEADKVDCRYKNGILELRLPRTAEAQAKRIEVKS
jgi:HSP20 family protein